jgi:hypothetical protein
MPDSFAPGTSFAGGQIDRQQLLLRSIPIQKRIFTLAEQDLNSSHREVANLALALWKHNERLFTFLDINNMCSLEKLSD